MLLEALKKIQEMSSFSLAQLAGSLKVDTIMAAHVVEQLKAMGYLKEEVMGLSCDGNCKKCAGCPSVGVGSIRPIKTLTITEKGNIALKHMI